LKKEMERINGKAEIQGIVEGEGYDQVEIQRSKCRLRGISSKVYALSARLLIFQ
jgi:hypothetical protein